MATKHRIKYTPYTASGRREGWAKLVEDIDREARGAKAFQGAYLPKHQEYDIEHGALVLEIEPMGSAKNGYEQAHLKRATRANDSDWPVIFSCKWREDFLTLLDKAEEALGENNEPNEPEDALRGGDQVYPVAALRDARNRIMRMVMRLGEPKKGETFGILTLGEDDLEALKTAAEVLHALVDRKGGV